MSPARVTDLDQAWSLRSHGPRLRAVRRATEGPRERFAAGPRCLSVPTLPLSRLAFHTQDCEIERPSRGTARPARAAEVRT
jgi:hypothetical protein